MLACAPAAAANDSTAELVAGGLVITRTDGIEMRSEDLFISQPLVRVRYRFANTTGKDISTVVAFPMPDVTGAFDFMEAVPTKDPQNLLGFATTVDGKPVQARVEQKAVLNGVDRTTMLAGLGVPLAPHLDATVRALDQLPAAKKAELLKLEMVVENSYDAGGGEKVHLTPLWTLKSTWYWTQLFRAGREIAVEHRYQPSVGTSSGTVLELKGDRTPDLLDPMRKQYCVDDAFLAAIDRATRGAGDRQVFWEKRIGYVLKTGGNWKGPIGDFHLVIDKGSPDSLMSFCADGVTKIGPTRFEVHKTGFKPERDLSILILERLPMQQQ